MDGLLLDSEVLWHEAEVEIFGSLGVPLEDASERSTKGLFVAEVVDYWFSQYPWTGQSCDDVVAMLLQRVGDLIEEKGVMLPGAERDRRDAVAHEPVGVESAIGRPQRQLPAELFGGGLGVFHGVASWLGAVRAPNAGWLALDTKR